MNRTDNIEDLYPYTADDLETVKPSEVRVGDLLASGGPQGCHRFVGDKVIAAGWAGYDKAAGCDKYLITKRQANWDHEIILGQPESIPMRRVREDRIRGDHR